MASDDTERVTMIWPKALKADVKDKVGARGLTDFTIAAVRTRMIDGDPVGEARALAQHYAEMLQGQGVPINGQVPDWLTVRPAGATSAPTIVPPDERHRGSLEEDIMRTHARVGPGETAPIVEEVRLPGNPPVEPHAPIPQTAAADESWEGPRGASTEALDDLQAKAKTLGIDLGPASAIVRDSGPDYEAPPGDVPAPTVPPEEPDEIEGRPVETVRLPEAGPPCPECGDPMVNGACWNVHF